MLPLLEPFSEVFVRHACLLSPSLLDVEEHLRAANSGQMIRYAFAISAAGELREKYAGVWTEAAAAWSHVNAIPE